MTSAHLAWAALAVIFTYIFLANAWLGDDAYITFRTAWNAVNGYGLTFNPSERVQSFTHPLWALLVSAVYALTGEFFFTVTLMSWIFCLATGAVLLWRSETVNRSIVLVGWLLTSKALADYTSSGLENPLSYLLLALFYTRYLRRQASETPSLSELRWFTLVAALGFLTRPDAALLYMIPVAEMAIQCARRRGLRTLAPLATGVAPALIWLGFATLYYGFPLPNTYYAKVANGIPRALMIQQGTAYFLNSVRWDPITLGTVGLAAVVGIKTRGVALRAAASACLYVLYTVYVGGDFMSGRFFTLPFLVSTAVLVPVIASAAIPWVLAGLVSYNLLMPLVPVKTSANYDGAWPWRSQNGIKDERGHYHRATNILFFSPFRELPDLVFAQQGRSFREAPERTSVEGSIGMFGLYAGPEKHVVDRNALSDPFLARLPVSPRLYFEFYAGHYFRDLPEGYLESLERDENLVRDARLHDFYDQLRNVTRGAVFRWDRLFDIWALNAGAVRSMYERFEQTRPIALSVRADNERFLTHVGRRDPALGALRTTGRRGFLQYGPGIPLKAGAYRVRWVGVLQATPGENVGFVDVSLNGISSVERKPLIANGSSTSGPIAYVDFTIDEPATAIDYRLWVGADVQLTLERVELYSAFAIPDRRPDESLPLEQ